MLQTLALIQRQADSQREVARLARSQERQLRAVAVRPTGYGVSRSGADTSGTETHTGPVRCPTLAEACGEVEDAFAISVQHVVVGGEVEVDERSTALVQAAREAIVNAAKHAGVDEDQRVRRGGTGIGHGVRARPG